MNIQLIYDSPHGKTKFVSSKFNCECVSAKNAVIWADIVLFLCPTYGDEELPHEMEDFLLSLKIRNKSYVVCELGNYYGYDDFTFGAKKIIEEHLNSLGWDKFYNGISLDSLPKIDWDCFFKWKKGLDHALQNRCK